MHIAYRSSLILFYALFGYGYVLFEFIEMQNNGYYSVILLLRINPADQPLTLVFYFDSQAVLISDSLNAKKLKNCDLI